jgi:hypothetical protein
VRENTAAEAKAAAQMVVLPVQINRGAMGVKYGSHDLRGADTADLWLEPTALERAVGSLFLRRGSFQHLQPRLNASGVICFL